MGTIAHTSITQFQENYQRGAGDMRNRALELAHSWLESDWRSKPELTAADVDLLLNALIADIQAAQV